MRSKTGVEPGGSWGDFTNRFARVWLTMLAKAARYKSLPEDLDIDVVWKFAIPVEARKLRHVHQRAGPRRDQVVRASAGKIGEAVDTGKIPLRLVGSDSTNSFYTKRIDVRRIRVRGLPGNRRQ